MTEQTQNEKQQKIDLIAKIIVIAIIAILSIAIILNLQGKEKSTITGNGQKPKSQGTITVSTTTIEKTSIESTIRLNGEISSKYEINIFPDTAGKIINLPISLGQNVTQNMTIGYIDPSKPGSFYSSSPIISTVQGTIIDIPVTVGDTVTTGTTIATLGSVSDLEIEVNVSEKYSTYLKKGLPAYIKLVSLPNESFSAQITKISPVVNKTKRTIAVTLEFDKKDSRIKPGMFCSMELVTQKANNTIVVPKSAISSYNGEPVVYTLSPDNIAKRCNVETGLSNDTEIQIISGLKEGDIVVTAGSVYEGAKTRIAK